MWNTRRKLSKTALKLKADEIMTVPLGKGEAKSLVRKMVRGIVAKEVTRVSINGLE